MPTPRRDSATGSPQGTIRIPEAGRPARAKYLNLGDGLGEEKLFMKQSAGIDIGGTKIQAVVVDDQFRTLGAARCPTPQEGGPTAVVEACKFALEEACLDAGAESDQLRGVGVGSPGQVDPDQGLIAKANNLPDWGVTVPFAEMLGQRIGTSVHVGNDVGVALDAENHLGAGRRFSSYLGVFWGTGIGGGVILENQHWHGRGTAGEIGHMVVKKGGAQCSCGRFGCLEAYAGRGAMERRARQAVQRGAKTKLFQWMEHKGRQKLTSGVWSKAVRHGDELAEDLLTDAISALGQAIASAINLLDLEAIVIGGGMGIRFAHRIQDELHRAMLPHLFVPEDAPEIAISQLGDHGGALGACMLVGGQHPVIGS